MPKKGRQVVQVVQRLCSQGLTAARPFVEVVQGCAGRAVYKRFTIRSVDSQAALGLESTRVTPPDEIVAVDPTALLPVEEKPWTPTARQAAFVSEYLVDLHGTRAAIRAGYAAPDAAVSASRLLSHVNIRALIDKGKESRAKMIGMTAAHVVHELSIIANARVDHYYIDDLGDVKPTPEAPEGAMAAIQSIDKETRVDKEGNITFRVRFKLWDKPGQLKIMGKHAGVAACSDKVELTGPDGGPVQITRVERVIVYPKAE